MFLILIFLFCVYLYGIRNFKYWKDRGVKHGKPFPFVGNNLSVFLCLKSEADMNAELYQKYPNEQFVGNFSGQQPVLTLRDPDLIKRILVTDFSAFHARRLTPDDDFEGVELLFKQLSYSCGDTWKLLRQKTSPFFTASKLRCMFPIIENRAMKLQRMIEVIASNGKDLDAKEVMARYSTDVIADYGMGIDVDSLHNDKTFMRNLGTRVFTKTKRDAFVYALKTIFPEMCSRLHFFSSDIEKSSIGLFRNIVEKRNHTPIGRNDFIDYLLETKGNGMIVGESMLETNPDGSPKTVELEFNESLMIAQMSLFFAAGFETSSSSSSYTLHELAYHPEVQKKCQQEIDEVLSRYDNKLCYDAIREMKYLEMCFMESLRLFPPISALFRKCTKKYMIPGTELTIDKGVMIYVPLQALHFDEKYFHNPHQFIPERFSPENYTETQKFVFLPFGQGPRSCVGQRLGIMQAMAGIAAILQNYTIAPSEKSRRYPEISKSYVTARSVKGGLPIQLFKRAKLLSSS